MSCHYKCTPAIRTFVIVGVGVLLLVVGIILGPVIVSFVHDEVKKSLVLRENTQFFKMWKDVPYPIYQQFYMFNIENPDAVIAGEKPILRQQGPYTYREIRVKENITFSEDGVYLNYTQKKYYMFVREMSCGDEQDYVVAVNALLPALSQLLRYSNDVFLKNVTNIALEIFKENLFQNRTVKQIVWGYHDSMLELAKKLAPHWFYTDVVGYMAGKNGSIDGYYQIHTGLDDIQMLGQISLYNDSSKLHFWTSSLANKLKGSDGSLHGPFVQKSATLWTFVTDVCRSFYGDFKKEFTSKYGLKMYQFVAPMSMFANATVNHDNAGYCTPPGNCLGTGVLNLSTCQIFDNIHMPVVLSKPHFLDADPKYSDAVIGLHPNATLHETLISVEPMTGLTLSANKRLQLNLAFHKDPQFDDLRHMKNMIFPVVWVEEMTIADKESSDKLDSMLFKPIRIATAIRYTLIAVGCVLIVAAVIYIVVATRRKKISEEYPPLLPSTNS